MKSDADDLHDELLLHAEAVVARNQIATEAELRRAVSSAYYAVFDLLCDEVAKMGLNRADLAPLRPLFRRAFDHGHMLACATAFGQGSLPRPIVSVLSGGPSSVHLLLIGRLVNEALIAGTLRILLHGSKVEHKCLVARREVHGRKLRIADDTWRQ